MYFLQATQAPIVVHIGAKKVRVDKLLLEDIVTWAGEIASKREAKATEGMDEVKLREYMTFYPPATPDLNEMKRILRTPEGVRYIVTTCLERAQVAAGEIEHLIKINGTGRLAGLAWVLADLDDNSIMQRPSTGDDEGPKPDPLT